MITKEELRRIVYDEVKADIETEAAAENAYQEGYAVGFNDCRYRVVEAIWKRLGGTVMANNGCEKPKNRI